MLHHQLTGTPVGKGGTCGQLPRRPWYPDALQTKLICLYPSPHFSFPQQMAFIYHLPLHLLHLQLPLPESQISPVRPLGQQCLLSGLHVRSRPPGLLPWFRAPLLAGEPQQPPLRRPHVPACHRRPDLFTAARASFLR